MTILRSCLFCVLVVLASVAAGGARADSTPPPSSAIAQYVEQIPTAAGGKAIGVGKAREGRLSKKQDEALARNGGKDAPLLKKVATSSAFGAPQETTPAPAQPSPAPPTTDRGKTDRNKPVTLPVKPHDRPVYSAQPVPSNVSAAESASAAIHAIGSGSKGRVLGLGIAMLLITVAAVIGTALRQRRSS